ncbi:hypothetical protein RRG08_015045 [Elysia crispata]|uniref:Uncharacterized protein n=1 Tax=Elysia crispata TaxID=231223 RepID=A0AAE1B5J9_9GAST|nr:hypothetical protein RRG08_015045 [Elysia crispata]
MRVRPFRLKGISIDRHPHRFPSAQPAPFAPTSHPNRLAHPPSVVWSRGTGVISLVSVRDVLFSRLSNTAADEKQEREMRIWKLCGRQKK